MSLNLDIDSLPPEKVEAAITRLEAVKAQRAAESKLFAYKPHPKQCEFHAAGAAYRERLLMAGNQTGKSLAAAMEVAMHATGIYPDWWEGRRFDRALRIWACGETSEVVRETIQLLLLGQPGLYGTGAIPKGALIEVIPARGIANLVDMIRVRHTSGGISSIALKEYSQGRERFAGATIDFAWLDEEPPPDVFTETLTRLNTTTGPLMLTFTPHRGVTDVVKRFILEPDPHRVVITMALDDATFYTDEQRVQIRHQYPEHEVDARVHGIPAMGSGRVFTVDEDTLMVDPFECPKHWIRVGGMDFGWTHYAAFCELWQDRDRDIVYLVRTLRMRQATPLQHVEAVRNWRLTWAWPADGKQATLAGAGKPLMRQYADAGLDMMGEAASFPDKGNSVEAGVQLMIDRMRGGRWKVFRGDNEGWLEEYRLYHRDKDGLLVKQGDDAISASRYALMMVRDGICAERRIINMGLVFRGRRSAGWMAH